MNRSRLRISLVSAAVIALASSASALDLGNVLKGGQSAVKAATLSDSDIKELTDRACVEMDAKSKVAGPSDKYAARLVTVMQGMPTTIKDQPINAKVYLTSSVNAWAMANGCVRVYSGLMDMMNDDELRGVIGHEEGHVALGHTRKAMQTAYATSAARDLANSAGGAAASLSSSQMGELAEKFINAQFSQTQESDADNYSFDLLTEKKLPREGLVTAFQKLAKLDGGKSSMLSSHPSSASRAENMQKKIDKKP